MLKHRRSSSLLALLTLGCLLMASVQGLAHATPPGLGSMTVLINEVAWGGTAASATDQWIELYNPGTGVIDLTGWHLLTSDASLDIPLSGTILAGGYYLLENNADDLVISNINVPNSNLFTGTLATSNQSLILYDGGGNVVDMATAIGGNWPAGAAGYSMERGGLLPDGLGAWGTNNGVTRNGLDRGAFPNPPAAINGTPGQPNSFIALPTLTATPVAPLHLVISEVRFHGLTASDEFVEFFNPTGGTVNISGWMLRKSSGCGTSLTTIATIPSNTYLLPGQHYLVAYGGSTVASMADLVYTTSSYAIPDDGGVALTNSLGAIIDQVGLCAFTYFYEDVALPALTDNLNQGYERKPGGLTSCYDTNDNSTDFQFVAPSNPQNSADPLTLCTGVAFYTPTNTVASTPTPFAPTHLVISELRFHGPLGADDDFIELFNPTGAQVNIGGWTLRKSSSCGTTLSNVLTFPASTILPPGGHYLTALAGSTASGIADLTFSSSISDDGGVALVNGSGAIVDQVGLCASTTYREGTSLLPWSNTTDQSYERLPGGLTSCYDRDNNRLDFQLISPPGPQNSTTAAAMCAGVGLYTPTSTATLTPTRTPTRTITPIPGILVLNEFLPHASTDWNADGRIDVDDEYIEIINMGTETVNIKGWRLDDGEGGSSAYSLPDLTLQPRQIARFFGSQTGILLNDGGDSVRLLRPGGQTADIYNYPVIAVLDRAWCRLPDGIGLWTFSCQPTPGRINARADDLGTPQPPSNETDCPLSDSAPPAIYQAECGDAGLGSWWDDLPAGDGIWLVGREKWDIFIH